MKRDHLNPFVLWFSSRSVEKFAYPNPKEGIKCWHMDKSLGPTIPENAPLKLWSMRRIFLSTNTNPNRICFKGTALNFESQINWFFVILDYLTNIEYSDFIYCVQRIAEQKKLWYRTSDTSKSKTSQRWIPRFLLSIKRVTHWTCMNELIYTKTPLKEWFGQCLNGKFEIEVELSGENIFLKPGSDYALNIPFGGWEEGDDVCYGPSFGAIFRFWWNDLINDIQNFQPAFLVQ